MSTTVARRQTLMDQGRTLVVLRGAADVSVVDALARLHLVARACGGSCEIRAGADLAALLELIGLSEVLGQPVRQSEAREQRCRVEEVVQVDEPSV